MITHCISHSALRLSLAEIIVAVIILVVALLSFLMLSSLLISSPDLLPFDRFSLSHILSSFSNFSIYLCHSSFTWLRSATTCPFESLNTVYTDYIPPRFSHLFCNSIDFLLSFGTFQLANKLFPCPVALVVWCA